MNIIQSSPILEAEAKSGLKKYWQGHVLFDGDDYYVNSESWQDLKDGGQSKHNESVPYLTTIKNVGKSNETTPLEQAVFELASMVTKQRDKKNYVEPGKKISRKKLPLPMLAQKHKDHSKKILFPCFVQPKLDGNRMVFDGSTGMSRGGKPFIPEVIDHLLFDVDVMLDGELILPDMPPLQTTMSAIKRYQPDLSPTLIYWVYDIVDESLMQFERLTELKKLESILPDNVKLVETTLVKNAEELQAKHEEYVLDGYEGTIVRNYEGMYEIGHRSYDLQKKKDFQDEEFEIIDVISGEGLYDQCAIFVCKTKEGKTFRSNPEGTIQQKRQYYMDRKSLKGQFLTCRFFEKTLDGIPTFNVGVSIRDKEEF
jgi:DNA ligase-1